VKGSSTPEKKRRFFAPLKITDEALLLAQQYPRQKIAVDFFPLNWRNVAFSIT
jgi:hypothetical protein